MPNVIEEIRVLLANHNPTSEMAKKLGERYGFADGGLGAIVYEGFHPAACFYSPKPDKALEDFVDHLAVDGRDVYETTNRRGQSGFIIISGETIDHAGKPVVSIGYRGDMLMIEIPADVDSADMEVLTKVFEYTGLRLERPVSKYDLNPKLLDDLETGK